MFREKKNEDRYCSTYGHSVPFRNGWYMLFDIQKTIRRALSKQNFTLSKRYILFLFQENSALDIATRIFITFAMYM